MLPKYEAILKHRRNRILEARRRGLHPTELDGMLADYKVLAANVRWKSAVEEALNPIKPQGFLRRLVHSLVG